MINFTQKPLIAGKVPNTRENLRKWLKKPSSIKKGTRMPNLGLADEEIELLIEYIQTL
jgi:cytochrome c2